MAVVVRNRFYPQIALALALFTIIGFARTYYLRFLSDLPPLVTLVQLHGLAFTAWLVLFVVQARFIAAHRVQWHMRLGIAGAVLAAVIVALAVAVLFHTAAIPRVRPSGLTPSQFAFAGFVSIGLYAAFVALGLAFRRRAALHKRFMVLAVIAALGPATGRFMQLFALSKYAYFIQPMIAAVFITWCLVYDWRKNRIVHPAFVIGGLVIIASWPLKDMVARSEWWAPIGEWVARVGAGV